MIFSRRTDWDRTPNELAGLRAGSSAGVVDLTGTNPTHAGLAADPARLGDALGDPRNVVYEPEALGSTAAREVLARWLRGRGWSVPADRLVLTASTSEAYSWLFTLACDPGDVVMVPTPSYPLFDFLARLAGVEAISYPLRLGEEGWRLDVDALAHCLPDSARLLLVVSPNNPTGHAVREDEARSLAALARDRGLALVSDEVFGDFAWGEPRSGVVADACAREGALGFVLSGLSKACGLPQVKLGWISVAGPDAAVHEALARLELVADTHLSVATPPQNGLAKLLEIGDEFRDRLLPRLRANVALLRDAAPSCGTRVLPADGGWQAVLALGDDDSEQAVVEALLRDHRVLVQPGWLFDMPLPSLIVSLLPEERTFARGVERLARGLSASPARGMRPGPP